MALPVNRIGSFTFLVLEGNPEAIKRQLEISVRPGVDGITATRTGRRGVPFTLQSRVDTADRAAARTLYLQYRELIGADPVDLVWWDIASTGESQKVLVRDVRQVTARPLLASSGGLNSPSKGFLVCDWDLICVAY